MNTDTEALRENHEERAAILEFDAGYPRHQAESMAWGMVYGQVQEHQELDS